MRRRNLFDSKSVMSSFPLPLPTLLFRFVPLEPLPRATSLRPFKPPPTVPLASLICTPLGLSTTLAATSYLLLPFIILRKGITVPYGYRNMTRRTIQAPTYICPFDTSPSFPHSPHSLISRFFLWLFFFFFPKRSSSVSCCISHLHPFHPSLWFLKLFFCAHQYVGVKSNFLWACV